MVARKAFKKNIMNKKSLRGPVRFGVHPANEIGSPQYGQTEIAVPALGRWHVTFHLVVKTEKLMQPFSPNDKIVKGRKDVDLSGDVLPVQALQQRGRRKVGLLQIFNSDLD